MWRPHGEQKDGHNMKKSILLLVSLAFLALIPSPASAGRGVEGVDYINAKRPHCVTTAYSAEWIDAGKDSSMIDARCYPTFEEAQVAAASTSTMTNENIGTAVAASFTYQAIAVHCDGSCVTGGPTLTINGTDCTGGGLVFSDTWDDRVDQNRHKRCYQITLYAVENYTGGCSTFGFYNNDRTPCISLVNSNEAARYYGPVN